jgi:hypothetical protein
MILLLFITVTVAWWSIGLIGSFLLYWFDRQINDMYGRTTTPFRRKDLANCMFTALCGPGVWIFTLLMSLFWFVKLVGTKAISIKGQDWWDEPL